MLDAIFQHAETTRLDKQTGAPVSANGTTISYLCPGATNLLSVAVGIGALTQTTSGTTTTVSGNIGQLITTFKNPVPDFSLKGIPVLENMDATVSVANAPGNGTGVPVTDSSTGNSSAGSAMLGSTSVSVSGATLRYQLFNKYDPKSPQFKSAFQNFSNLNQVQIQKSKITVLQACQKFIDHYQPLVDDHDTRDAEAAKFLAAADTTEIINLFNTYFFQTRQKVSSDPSFGSDLGAFVAAMNADLSLYRQIVESAKGVPALTFEYSYSNSPNQPVTHNARVIAAYQNSSGVMFSFNAAATFYGKLPSGVQTGHFRDGQAALQGDIPIAPSATGNLIDLTFAGYGQYQQAASILTVSQSDLPTGFPPGTPAFVAGTKGWIGIAQVKLTLRGPTGVQIVPVSWKWANRTDLLNKSDNTFSLG